MYTVTLFLAHSICKIGFGFTQILGFFIPTSDMKKTSTLDQTRKLLPFDPGLIRCSDRKTIARQVVATIAPSYSVKRQANWG